MRELVSLALGLCLVFVVHSPVYAEQKLPILDMHMHARLASHYGPPPQVICAPVSHMPYWDPSTPLHSVLETAPCENPLRSPTTDKEVLAQTIAMMERHNIYGVLGGTPELVATWMAAAPGRFIPGLDFRLDRAGYGKRVMFGSDQMVWPGLIEAAIQSIEEAPFLTPEQKRDIFHNNAARFLRLSPEEIAGHHGD